ncbi:allantoicase [bacterium]|nr:allantoicase [bacterium]
MQINMTSDNPFKHLIDLASERFGGKALIANDDFFASKSGLVRASEPIFIPGKYTTKGKWMDGWESRRRRTPGHDWCILKLGVPGIIKGIDVNTTFFTGNYPEHFSLEATYSSSVETSTSITKTKVQWVELVSKTPLKGDSHNFFSVNSDKSWTHLRLNIFPDGGVARLRVYGIVTPNWEHLKKQKTPIDLAAVPHGAQVITCNDNHYGKMENLILPGRALNMGDGWETKRKRVPGYDWIVVKLGTTGRIKKIEVDTNFFKGNYPDSCSIEGCRYSDRNLKPEDFSGSKQLKWVEILPKTKLKPHFRHFFDKALTEATLSDSFDYIRLNIYPDGGVSRLRIYGFAEK